MGVRTRIRDDLTTPVLVVNSEFEVPHLAGVGQRDSRNIRIWEVAGTPHAPLAAGRADDRGWEPNSLGYGRVHESALRCLQRWLTDGTAPSTQPRVAVEQGMVLRVRRDDLGNAIGGIRLPELAAPVREYRGMAMGSGRAPLFGASRPFPDDVVRALYPTRQVFLDRWNAAVEVLVDSGAIRSEDGPLLVARGEAVELPI